MHKLSIKRPITTVMVLLVVVMAGLIAYGNFNLELMPEVDLPIAVVMTTYVGAAPEEIEELITKPIEESMSTVSNVDNVTSITSSNMSTVIVQFVDGTDINLAAIDMREKTDMIKGRLPDASDDPLVMKLDINAMPIMIGLTSNTRDLVSLNDFTDNELKKEFERIAGVAAVGMSGGIEKEIEITIIPEKLKGYGISTQQISQALTMENINLPAGKIQQGTSKMQLRAVGEFKTIDEIRNLPITTHTGSVVYIRDLAEVQEVIKERDSYFIVNGAEGVVLSIDKQSVANMVDVSDRIQTVMNRLEKKYPDLEITMLTDTSNYIKQSINSVVLTAFQSALVAVFVLILFLGDIKTSLIIGISIPVSIMATFALMYLKGMTMNTISMGGIVIGIGMLVDNSVVVLENIFTHWKAGLSPKEASKKGAGEVIMAVFGSTLTTVAIFIPLMFMPGMMGTLLQDLAYTIGFALTASYVVSITFVPMACSRILKEHVDENEETNEDTGKEAGKKKKIAGGFVGKWLGVLDVIDNTYGRILTWSLRNKTKVVIGVFVIFIASLAIVPLVGVELMPETDEGAAAISVELPKGSILEETEKIISIVMDRIKDIEEIETAYATVGAGLMSSDANSASIQFNLVGKKERSRSTNEVCEEIKILLADIAGAEITVSPSGMAMGSLGGNSDLTLHVTGDDMDKLKEVSQDIMATISTIEGAKDIESSSKETVPEANIIINRNKASQYGISTSAIAGVINTAVTGSVATQYKVDGTEIDIRIRHDKEKVNYINDISNLTINTATGSVIPITEVAEIQIKQSADSISKENLQKYISVNASVDGMDQGTFRRRVEEKLESYAFPDGYGYEVAGTMEQLEETFTNMIIIFVVAVALVYMIMAAQFESFIHPLIIMLCMPISVTGGVFGLFIAGQRIGVTALMGFIMLVGMVVNNGIVLVDYANQLMTGDEGLSSAEALLKTGPNRLRPILMTTLTTIVGLIPMAIGNGEGMEIQKPLAVTVIFGLLASTMVTLIFIPVLYEGVERFRFRSRKKTKKQVVEQI